MNNRSLIALTAVAVATALSAPAGAEAAACFKGLPGPETDWEIQQDGTHDGAAYLESGSNFDTGHGRLTVNGVAYPAIPNADDACTTTSTSIQFPSKHLGGGVVVHRKVASVNGRVRHLDTIINTTDDWKNVVVDFGVEVLASQIAIDSEDGGFEVTSNDHWSVHENSGGSHPFLQWGQAQNSHDPKVVSEDEDNPTVWRHEAGSMPDATLVYDAIPVAPNESIKLLHISGTSSSEDASRAAAKDTATPFKGLTRAQANQVVNWSNDPDNDGVEKFFDECPSTKGDQPNGCTLLIGNPQDGGGGDDGDGGNGGSDQPVPPADQPPADTPSGGDVAPTGGPQGGGGVSGDTTAPGITVSRLGRKAKRAKLRRKGLKPRIACSEACSLTVAVKARGRTALTRSSALSGAPRTLRLKLRSRHVRRAARVTIVITATDAAGNRSTISRVVKVKR